MTTREDIIEALDQKFENLYTWLDAHDPQKFSTGPEGKWTTGQHVQHLIQSTNPLNKALRLPKLQLKVMFGKRNREGRNYDTVVAKYTNRLAEGGVSSKQFEPKAIQNEEKADLIGKLKKEQAKLTKVVAKWKEKDLDDYILPHPLLGKMTVREILYFTIYHTEHHTNALQRDY